jgi:tetratricopeptide (TPR) repeat protein
MAIAPGGVVRALTALSAAVSLTDSLAVELVRECAPAEYRPESVVDCLRMCDFVTTDNGEWHIESSSRSFLLQRLREDKELAWAAHDKLRLTAAIGQSGEAPTEVSLPKYLTWHLGLAYHTSVFDPLQGLEEYRRGFRNEYTREQWLLAKLAEEQQESGVLPADAVEPLFFRGMSFYRENMWQEAETYFKRVEQIGGQSLEVATALHLLGRIYHHYYRDDNRAEDYLRRSLNLHRPYPIGEAQVLNSLGNVIGKKKPREAERLLRRSLSLRRRMPFDDEFGEAQVLHSLANIIGKKREKLTEAEGYLRRSLKIRRKIGSLSDQAQVLLTWGNLIKDVRRSEAIKLMRESLEIRKRLGNVRDQARVLHTLGKLVGQEDFNEADKLLRSSLQIEKQLHNASAQAMLLTDLGHLYLGAGKWQEARKFYRQTLNLKQTTLNRAFTHWGLADIAERYEKDMTSAREHLEKAVSFARRAARRDLIEKYSAQLSKLRREGPDGGS